MVLALYDCRSKQEYIYRTNHIQEITGGSALLADLFRDFFRESTEFRIMYDWEHAETPQDYLAYFQSSGYDGEVIYEGGGNLCMIYRDRETYLRVNRALSKKALENTFSVSIIAACAEIDPSDEDFSRDRRKLYEENARRKNLGTYSTPCNVLPFTQVDRLTYQPVTVKRDEQEYTTERWNKQQKFNAMKRIPAENHVLQLDSMTDKGKDSILAVIYIDGNNMGAKVKAATEDGGRPVSSYSDGIRKLRAFSVKTNEDFVKKPVAAIEQVLLAQYTAAAPEKKHYYKYRRVISGGDEITLICNAHAVPMILRAYFDTLAASGGNSACAGVALFHSHAPFTDVYAIAEQCCESGKQFSHLPGNGDRSYIDFHYCHAGITNDLETIRETQEGKYTAKPYEYTLSAERKDGQPPAWQDFVRLGQKAAGITRSDVKSLADAIVRGDSHYREMLRMLRSRKKMTDIDETDSSVRRMLFDIASVADLWFIKEGREHE